MTPASSIASQMSWAEAMGLVVLEGLVITVLVLAGIRGAVFRAIPTELKTAISVGIGLFIALIGLVDGGIVRTTGHPSPPLQMGNSGTDLISGGGDGGIQVWRAATGEKVRQLRGHRDRVSALAVAPGGKALGSASADGTFKVPFTWTPSARISPN